MPELEIGLVDGGELNFNQSVLQFHVKKKAKVKSSNRFDFKCWIRDTASLNNQSTTTVMPISQ